MFRQTGNSDPGASAHGELLTTGTGGGGGGDVNLTEVGGVAIALGQAAMAASLPVVIASNQTAIPVSGTVTATNASVSATGAAVPASATYVGRLDASGNLAGLVSGSGTAATAIRVELPTNGTGVIATVGAVTTITNPVTVSGTVTANIGTSGALALAANQQTDALTDTQLRATAVPVSSASLPLPAGASTAANQTAVIGSATGGAAATSAVLTGGVHRTAPLALTNGQQAALAISDEGVLQITISDTVLPLPTGAATAALQTQPGVDIGDVTVNNAAGAAAVNVQDGGNSLTVDGTVTAAQATAANLNATVVGTGTFAVQATAVGTIADDATTPGAPVMVGGSAKSPDGTDPGSVSAENDVTRAITDLNRRVFVNDNHPRSLTKHLDGSTAYTDEALIADPGDGFQVVITNIIGSTGSATAFNFFLEEGSTKIFGPIYLEAIAGRGFCSGPIYLPCTASTAVTLTSSASIAQSFQVNYFIQAV